MRTDEELRRVGVPGELRKLTDAELDRLIEMSNATIVAGDLLDESRRRDAARSERTIRLLTVVMTVLTLVITAATIVLVMRGD